MSQKMPSSDKRSVSGRIQSSPTQYDLNASTINRRHVESLNIAAEIRELLFTSYETKARATMRLSISEPFLLAMRKSLPTLDVPRKLV